MMKQVLCNLSYFSLAFDGGLCSKWCFMLVDLCKDSNNLAQHPELLSLTWVSVCQFLKDICPVPGCERGLKILCLCANGEFDLFTNFECLWIRSCAYCDDSYLLFPSLLKCMVILWPFQGISSWANVFQCIENKISFLLWFPFQWCVPKIQLRASCFVRKVYEKQSGFSMVIVQKF